MQKAHKAAGQESKHKKHSTCAWPGPAAQHSAAQHSAHPEEAVGPQRLRHALGIQRLLSLCQHQLCRPGCCRRTLSTQLALGAAAEGPHAEGARRRRGAAAAHSFVVVRPQPPLLLVLELTQAQPRLRRRGQERASGASLSFKLRFKRGSSDGRQSVPSRAAGGSCAGQSPQAWPGACQGPTACSSPPLHALCAALALR